MKGLLHSLPLSLRAPLAVAALMLLVGAVASQQVLATLGDFQQARIRELAQLHIEALSVALGPHVLRNDVWEIYDTLERATGQSEGQRIRFSAVADTGGHVLAATDPRRAPIDSPIAPLAQGAQSPANLTVSRKQKVLRLLAPLVYQGRRVGQILTELDVSDLIAERRRTARLLLLGNALATLLLAAMGYLALRRMLRPVTRLTQLMRATAQSPEPIPDSQLPHGDTEVAQLTRIYNDMARAVRQNAETERRMAERERFVSLGRLSSSLAHEINNPLGGLLNAADTIGQYANRPEVVRSSAALLKRGLNHLRDVTRATLDQNRLDRFGASLQPEDFDDLRLLITPEAGRNNQTLGWDIAIASGAMPELPAAPLRQIVLNLLLNATTAAGRDGRVGLAVSRGPDGSLVLHISDSGPGLSPSARARLLGEGLPPPGGGVGLRLVRDLVMQLHGTVAARRTGGMTVIEAILPAPTPARSKATPC